MPSRAIHNVLDTPCPSAAGQFTGDAASSITSTSAVARDSTNIPILELSDFPLVVDLDGTLLRTDLLHESFLALAKHNPIEIFKVPGWLINGKSALKRRLALAVNLDLDTLPVHSEVVEFAQAEAARGRAVYLATAADSLLARRIASQYTFFKDVIASDGIVNLAGPAKAARLVELFPSGFDYVGNGRADLHVWRVARSGILVDVPHSIARAARQTTQICREFPRSARLPPLLRALRLHQWAKNLLVFVPLILSGRVGDPHLLITTIFAFLALGAVASSTYLINDLWDLSDDRRHWSKQFRPFASGALPLSFGMVVPLGLAIGLGLAAVANSATVIGVLIYLITTLLYSFWFKRVPLLDTFVLAGLFTLRLAIGILACDAPPSPWLLVFSMFLFNSLSLAKRQTELIGADERKIASRRGYRADDQAVVTMIGIGSGLTAILILILYIIDDAFRQSFYGATGWLWGFPICVFLFVCRIWLMSGRGELNDDPVLFAVRDRCSIALGAVLFLCFAFAWLGAPLR